MAISLYELGQILATALAVIGVLFNNNRRRECFIIWGFSNSITLAYHLNESLYGLAVRDAIFLVLAVAGWIKWSKK